jgi:hypothetical protein
VRRPHAVRQFGSWKWGPRTRRRLRLRSKRSKTDFNGPKEKKQGYASGSWRLPYGKAEERGEGFVVRVRPNQDGIEMEAGGLGPEGPGALVPAWKGEVVHPGAPESQCVYRALFYRILSVLSL